MLAPAQGTRPRAPAFTKVTDMCWRLAEECEASAAHQLPPSPCDHAQEDAIPAHEVMIERRAHMRRRKASDANANQGMHEEKLFGEGAALAPDRRQLESAEDDDGRAIGRRRDPSREGVHNGKHVKDPMRGLGGASTHRCTAR